jgi:spore germination cell wall hydrolase CwlJ-like protein
MTDKLKAALACLTIMLGSVSNADPKLHYEDEIKCLAMNIYHEAKGEDYTGKIAVAFTTINRVQHEKFPSSICKVVWQSGQFSWTKNKGSIDTNDQSWLESLDVAMLVLDNDIEDPTNGALYFHATYIDRPYWTKGLRVTLEHGDHIFYTKKG